MTFNAVPKREELPCFKDGRALGFAFQSTGAGLQVRQHRDPHAPVLPSAGLSGTPQEKS